MQEPSNHAMGPGHKARSCSLGTGELALAGEQMAGLFRVHETHVAFCSPHNQPSQVGQEARVGQTPPTGAAWTLGTAPQLHSLSASVRHHLVYWSHQPAPSHHT